MITVRIRRLLLWVALPAAVLILLYTVLGFYLVPRLIRSGLHDFVAQNYHREIALGEVRFNPYTLKLDVNDFALPDSDGRPMVSFRHLLIDVTIASLWRLGPDFQAIVLEDPYARVVIKPDGALNFSELALPPSPKAKPETNAKPARVFISRLSVRGGNIAFEDRAHPSEFKTEIKPLTFDLNNFETVGKEGGTYDLSGASEAGERFSWSGTLSPAPFSSHGQFEIANLQARTIWSYLRDSVHFELPSGVISIAGDYDFTSATTPIGLGVNVHQVTVTDLGIRPQGSPDDYIKVTRLEVHETRADVAKRTVEVGNVHLDGGEVRVWAPGAGGAAVNLLELAGGGGAAPAPSGNAAASAPANAAPTAAGATAPGAPSDTTAWVVSVPDIALDNLKINGEDRKVSPSVALHLTDLGIHVTGFTTARTTPVAVTLTTKINGNSKLDAKADLSPDMTALKAQAELANLDLSLFQPYVTQQTDMTLRGGSLSTKLNAERSGDGKLVVTGDADLDKLRTIDNELKRDFIKFDHLQVAGIEYKANPTDTSKPPSLHIHDVLARALYARVIIEPDRSTNVSRVLRLKPAAGDAGATAGAATADAAALDAAAAAAASDAVAKMPAVSGAAASGTAASGAAAQASTTADNSTPGRHHKHHGSKSQDSTPPPNNTGMAMIIDAINIQDGSANYADLWIQPHFALGIQSLSGYVRGLSTDPSAHAKVDLQGKVDRYAPIHIWGETNPLAATAFSDIKMTFNGVELSSVTPYSGRFAGYKIEKGKLSADIEYKLDHRNLTATHKMVIDQLELGERVESPDAVKLPLKIAIALLKDRNGVIDLDLPVTGSLDNPQFKIGPIIWKVFVNVLEKVATAPFALLGHLFGGGEQMNYIDFRPGSAVLEQPEHDKLTALVKALKEKEKLELDVPVTYSADLDRPGLEAAHLNEQLLALKQEQSGGKHGKGKARATAANASGTAGPAANVPAAGKAQAAIATEGKPQPEGAQVFIGSQPPDSAPPPRSAVMDSPPPDDPVLTDPAQRYALLVQLYRNELGKSTPLPDSAKAVETTAKKEGDHPDFTAANTDLEAALTQKAPVPDTELETLGKHRARAIQDVLLLGTDINPSRVFVIGTAPKSAAEKDKVRVELALK